MNKVFARNWTQKMSRECQRKSETQAYVNRISGRILPPKIGNFVHGLNDVQMI